MSIGQRIKMTRRVQNDRDTNVPVERLTDNIGFSYYPYFTQPVLGFNDEYLLFCNNRTGSWQLYLLYIQDETAIQVTDGLDINTGCSCLDPLNRAIYFWSGRDLHRIDIDGKNDHILYSVPDGFQPSILSISSCGGYLAFAYYEVLAKSTNTGKIYSMMDETLFQRPRSVIMQYDVNRSAAHCLYGECEWYSHVSINPQNPHRVLFCHEGRWDFVQRLWVVDAQTYDVWPIVKQKRLMERSGHEYYTAKGRVVTQYAIRDNIHSNDWRHANIIVNDDDSGRETYWYNGIQPMHVQTSYSDEHLLAGDCGNRSVWGNDESDSWMTVIRLENNRSVMKQLCHHDTSWTAQNSHPHPVFSRDDRRILFNSDVGGNGNIYRVSVP